jgi:pyruvate formate lyase activating enzyme
LQQCALCGRTSRLIAVQLGVCAGCLRARPEEALALACQAHAKGRRNFGLPVEAPRETDGAHCSLCARDCVIGEGERGYCGLRTVQEGRLVHLAGTPKRGVLHWYRDPLPTNCVADWVCAGHERYGYHNLAVFYCSCTFDCLFCQNYHYREVDPVHSEGMSAQELADAANPRTFCVCYFGGDPASQMTHALASAQLLATRGVRICWETNGSAHLKLMDRAVELALRSGGTVKFDLKALDPTLHRALTGMDNQRTLENFARAASRVGERRCASAELVLAPPLLVASTLLVPGYVDGEEVGRIARFIADLDPTIPYALLAFGPHFLMPDLPTTSVRHAEEAEAAARAAGLANVRVGNRHLLSRAY